VARIRNAKTVAKRIDLQYFARLSPMRRRIFILSIALPLLAAGWILSRNLFHQQALYSAGPLSAAHAVFGGQCALCHVRNASFSAPVSDQTCLSCHSAPVHNTRQTFTPGCSSCHLEHKGSLRLSATADPGCTQCHADLKVGSGTQDYEPHISGFDHRHPEFAVLRPNQPQADPGTIRLNHRAHLQPTLRGPGGAVQMNCSDCHRPLNGNGNEQWPYSVAVLQPASQQPIMVGQSQAQQRKRRSVEAGPGAYMTAIKYVNQCAACHALQFDPLIATPAPHDKPENVHAFIVKTLTAYIAQHPEALKYDPRALPAEGVQTVGTVPTDEQNQHNFLSTLQQNPVTTVAGQPRNAQDWILQRTAAAETLLWEKNCRVCHIVTKEVGGQLPTEVKAIIPSRWYPNAEFDHQAHRMVKCTGCHLNIPNSKLTSDVNIPGIAICRDCHQQRGQAGNAAEGRCWECHSYHDWRKEQPVKGRVDIWDVRGSGPHATPFIAQ
jgi:hypothetical protein